MSRLDPRRFAVTGVGEFPFDMLRYDNCYPARGEDAALLYRHNSDLHIPRTVLLGCIAEKAWRPTVERWASFGWRVEPERA